MGVDNTVAVLARTVEVLESITDIGLVVDHIPGWRSLEELETAGGLVTLSDGVTKEHRFWMIEHMAKRQALSNQSDLVTHEMTLLGWIAAKQDLDQFAASTAAAQALKAQVVSAFDNAKVAYPNIGGEELTYDEEARVEEDSPLEFRNLLKVDYHVIKIRVAPREEVTRNVA